MCEYGFTEGTDFCSFLSESTGGRPSTDHQPTIDMAKELCMLQRTEKGKECRQYFIELERRWNDPVCLMARALVAADKQISSLREINAKLLPKAEVCDAIMDSKDAIPIGTAAKVLNCGMDQNRLFAFLREKSTLIANNQPHQKYIDEGWFRYIESRYGVQGETSIYIKTVVFQKGIRKTRELVIGKQQTTQTREFRDSYIETQGDTHGNGTGRF